MSSSKSSINAIEQLVRVVDKIGDIANSVQAKMSYFVTIGLLASSALAWKAFSLDSALWWNVVKCSVILLPALIWVVVWFVLNQLRDAPSLVAELVADQRGVFTNLHDFSLQEPKGLRGVFRTIREFRKEDGLEVIFDTISGVALLANPFFAILAFIAMAMLSMLVLISPFVLLL